MHAMSHHPRKELLDKVMLLSVECPLNRCNLDICPLYEVRKMERKARKAWIYALSDEDLRYVLTYHEVCMATQVL